MAKIQDLLPYESTAGYYHERNETLDDIESLLLGASVVKQWFEDGGRWTNYEATIFEVTDEDGSKIYVRRFEEVPATEMQDGGDCMIEYMEVFPYKVVETKYSEAPLNDEVDGKLEKLFEMQQELDMLIVEKHPDIAPTTLSEWVKQITIAMEDEISEIRGEINWKHWKAPKVVDTQKLHEEVIDLWHFLISLSLKVGLTPDEIMEVYTKKHAENVARQEGKSKEKDYRGNKHG